MHTKFTESIEWEMPKFFKFGLKFQKTDFSHHFYTKMEVELNDQLYLLVIA